MEVEDGEALGDHVIEIKKSVYHKWTIVERREEKKEHGSTTAVAGWVWDVAGYCDESEDAGWECDRAASLELRQRCYPRSETAQRGCWDALQGRIDVGLTVDALRSATTTFLAVAACRTVREGKE
ncbi:hypothetical protein PIB30_076272 [Stylosanthes scabra]|uniref:Uncharacterized protein n=1 Tax=Stylosanthes scabra TaxID=79078 RepID=A0ABU6QQC2_9FABA|nr:hypothetical protein [Stylosanthes scabra]